MSEDQPVTIRARSNFDGQFYVCGPDAMVASLTDALNQLGAATESVTFED